MKLANRTITTIVSGLCAFAPFVLPAVGFAADAPAPAEAPPPAVAEAPKAAIIARDYRLRAGDVVEIDVGGRPEFRRTARLFADGTFDYPVVGKVTAQGLTAEELAARLAEGLGKELRRPVVSVTVREIARPPRAFVLGAVTKTGPIDLPEPKPLRAVLAEAAPTEKADLSQVRVRLPDGATHTADFSQFHLTGQVKDELLIRGGEEIVVLERPTVQKPDPIHVTVLGEVAKPGTVEVEAGATILDVLEQAGGLNPGADPAAVVVKAPGDGAERPVNVERYLAGDTSAGYTPRGGDTLIVPERPLRVLVFGEVLKPGPVALPAGARVLDAYLQAGVSKEAQASGAELVRRGPDDRPITRKVNLADVTRGRDKENVPVEDGDVLFIPGKKPKRSFLEQLNTFLAPLWLLRRW
jgi:protein involved in polysaccharide export with SLBB domain